jgi:hypothetical protein
VRLPELVRFYAKCPRCGALPGVRCRTVSPAAERQTRGNHTERNRRYAEMRVRVLRDEALASRDSDLTKEA